VRVTPSLDTIGSLEICNPTTDSFIESDPVVAFDGTNYLVAWTDEKYGPSNYYHPFVARVSPAGVVLDSGIRVSTSSSPEYRPNIADDGTRSFIMWSGSNQGCFGRFVNRDGIPEGNVITIAGGTASGPDAAFGDSCYLAVWHSGAYPTLELYARLVSRAGELVGNTIPIATGAGCHRWADVIYDGENFLVVWMTGENNLPSTIYGQVVGDDGSLVGNRFAICGNEPQQRWWPSAAVSDSNFLVAWEQGTTARDVWGNVDLPLTGVAETPAQPFASQLGQTIARGVVWLANGPGTSPNPSWLLDAAGRKALELRVGPNNVRHLSPGVYFLHSTFGVRHSQLPTKVIIAR